MRVITSANIIANQLAMLPGFENQHPLINLEQGTDLLDSLYELQQVIRKDSGFPSISYSSGGFDTGLFSVIAMIKAWHWRQSDSGRSEFVLIGDATQFEIVADRIDFKLIAPTREITSVDRPWARLNCHENTAAVFLFPPAEVDISIADVRWIADRVHYCGGLIVGDSGVCRLLEQSGIAADEIVDLYLLDLFQLFGFSGPASNADSFALAANEQLSQFLPLPRLVSEDSLVRWSGEEDHPLSVGRTACFGANKFALLSLAIELQLQSDDDEANAD